MGVRWRYILFPLLSGVALGTFGTLAMLAHQPPEALQLDLGLPVLILSGIPAILLAGCLPFLSPRATPWWGIISIALVVRLLFLTPQPFLSDDVYRYLWDGRVQVAGISPYGVAPESAALDDVEARWTADERVRDRVNHPEIPTVYPPLLEMLFGLLAAGGGGLWTWRGFLILVQMGIAALLARVLRTRGLDARLVVLYLWHPLPIVESVWSAHTEEIAVLLFLGAIYLLDQRKAGGAGAVLGLAAAAKLLPLGFVPSLVRHLGLRPLVWLAATGAATAIPYLGTDLRSALGGLERYAQEWYFNDVLFHPVGEIVGIDVEDKTLVSTQILRAVLVGAFGVVCLVAAFRVRDPWRAALWVSGAFVVFTPTLHPWYLLWVLPLAIICGSRGWLLLSVTVLLSYVVQVGWREQGVWMDNPMVRALEFIPPFALLALDSFRKRRA